MACTRTCTPTPGRTAMLNTLPCPANQVSVHPPLSQMRIGAAALTTRCGAGTARTPSMMPGGASARAGRLIERGERRGHFLAQLALPERAREQLAIEGLEIDVPRHRHRRGTVGPDDVPLPVRVGRIAVGVPGPVAEAQSVVVDLLDPRPAQPAHAAAR